MKQWKRIVKGSLTLLLVLLGFLMYTAAGIYTYSKKSESMPADAAIVLGAAVWGDRPSPVFRERIRHAITLYEQGKIEHIIFTGGIGLPNARPESDVAKDYAIKHGVPAEAILTEEKSRITQENLQYAKQVAQREGLHTFLIVSDPLHMKRAVQMAEDLGMQALPSPTTTSRYIGVESQLSFLSKETLNYLGYRLLHLIG
ncbi:YdcF family protein [Aneurinibacillus sp. REN35]|uniref:YdcF family protein n=1 Tax=Aneurinibacillus sp. REN35 TaxID=3237286 RepID=UPI00352772C8